MISDKLSFSFPVIRTSNLGHGQPLAPLALHSPFGLVGAQALNSMVLRIPGKCRPRVASDYGQINLVPTNRHYVAVRVHP